MRPDMVSFGPTYKINGLPIPGKDLHATLTMKLSIRCPSSMTREVYMPQVPGWCSGRVVKLQDLTAKVSEDGRDATYTCIPGKTGVLVLQWQLGGPRCGPWDYDGFPPFFIEADPRNARLLKRAILTYPQRLE
jgi:hypothetical protein